MTEPDETLIDDENLLRILHEEREDAASYYTSELARSQAEAMDRYNAKPYGDGSEVPNRSQVVTHDIEDTINWIMPLLMRMLAPSDELITVDDDGLDDGHPDLDTAAKYLRHVLFKDNDGITVQHDFCFDALLQKVGIVRCYWEPPEPCPPSVVEGLSLEQAQQYLTDPKYDVLEASIEGDLGAIESEAAGMPEMAPPGMPGAQPGLMGGLPAPMMPVQPTANVTVALKVQKKYMHGKARAECVPPEEFRISRRAKSIKAADYHGWEKDEYLADIIRQHPDKAHLLDPDGYSIPEGGDDNLGEDERVEARFPDEPSSFTRSSRNNPERRKVKLHVEYIRGDFDRDNVVELRRVTSVGNVILENDVVDESEFVVWSPIRVSHRLIGRSLADTLLDIQRIRTVLTRKAMDSLTQSLAQRKFVNARAIGSDPSILDRILDHDIGDVIPVEGNPNEVIMTETTPDVSASAFQAIEYWDRRSEEASGVNRHAMGIQPKAITDTARGIDSLQSAANSRVEQVARWLSFGIEEILAKLLRLIVTHQDQPRVFKVAGRKLEADPRRWSDEMTVTVHVGTAESREKQISYLGMIAAKQEQVLLNAPNNPMVTLRHLRNTYAQIAKTAGFKNPGEFFGEVPENWSPQQPGEDPKLAEVKQKGELAAAELQGKQQLAQLEMQAKGQAQAADLAGKQRIAEIEQEFKQQMAAAELAAKQREAEVNADIQRQIAEMKLNSEREIAAQRLAQERELALFRMELEREMAERRMAMDRRAGAAPGNGNGSGIDQFREGGRLDA